MQSTTNIPLDVSDSGRMLRVKWVYARLIVVFGICTSISINGMTGAWFEAIQVALGGIVAIIASHFIHVFLKSMSTAARRHSGHQDFGFTDRPYVGPFFIPLLVLFSAVLLYFQGVAIGFAPHVGASIAAVVSSVLALLVFSQLDDSAKWADATHAACLCPECGLNSQNSIDRQRSWRHRIFSRVVAASNLGILGLLLAAIVVRSMNLRTAFPPQIPHRVPFGPHMADELEIDPDSDPPHVRLSRGMSGWSEKESLIGIASGDEVDEIVFRHGGTIMAQTHCMMGVYLGSYRSYELVRPNGRSDDLLIWSPDVIDAKTSIMQRDDELNFVWLNSFGNSLQCLQINVFAIMSLGVLSIIVSATAGQISVLFVYIRAKRRESKGLCPQCAYQLTRAHD